MKIQIEKPLLKSLAMMASMIEAQDAYTGGHLWRVSQYSQQLDEAAGLPTEMVFLSRLGGFMQRTRLPTLQEIVGTSERGVRMVRCPLRSCDHRFQQCQGRRRRLLPRLRQSASPPP